MCEIQDDILNDSPQYVHCNEAILLPFVTPPTPTLAPAKRSYLSQSQSQAFVAGLLRNEELCTVTFKPLSKTHPFLTPKSNLYLTLPAKTILECLTKLLSI